jgi:hypothetical protein
VDRRAHARNLLQEARLLKTHSNGNLNNGKKRAVLNLTAIQFFDSIIAYLDAPEARNDQDQL